MKKKYIVFSFFIIVFPILFFLWLSFLSYTAYKTSMEKVFNVDISILSELAPYKVSQAIINEESDEVIYSILNSNHKVFNIVITDCKTLSDECPNQKILYAQNDATLDTIIGAFWNPLKNPAPLYGEYNFEDHRSTNHTANHSLNKGDVIGRIYYASRVKQYSFIETLDYWAESLIGDFYNRVTGTAKWNDAYMYDKNAISSFLLFLAMYCVYLIYIFSNSTKKKLNSSIEDLKQKNIQLYSEREVLETDLERINSTITNYKEKLSNLETEEEKLTKKNDILLAKYNYILNYTLANRFLMESEFTAPMGNQVQKLKFIMEGLFQRTSIDTKDAIHDLSKAEVLKQEPGKVWSPVEIEKFRDNLEQSIDTINWTIENIRSITSLNTSIFDIYDCIDSFIRKRPPAANTKDIKLELIRSSNNLDIEANSAHIQAIVKNALYNSISAMNNYKRINRRNLKDFEALITIECGHYDENHVYLRITDNGPGIPEQFIGNIYESFEKVDENTSSLEGNGSLIVSSYLAMYESKVLKRNPPEGGFEVTFVFNRYINRDSKNV